MFIQIIGFLAAATSTISLIPQIYKSYKTRSAKDISILMLINFFITSILWVVYGVAIASLAVIGCNVIMMLFSIWLLLLSVKYDQT